MQNNPKLNISSFFFAPASSIFSNLMCVFERTALVSLWFFLFFFENEIKKRTRARNLKWSRKSLVSPVSAVAATENNMLVIRLLSSCCTTRQICKNGTRIEQRTRQKWTLYIYYKVAYMICVFQYTVYWEKTQSSINFMQNIFNCPFVVPDFQRENFALLVHPL